MTDKWADQLANAKLALKICPSAHQTTAAEVYTRGNQSTRGVCTRPGLAWPTVRPPRGPSGYRAGNHGGPVATPRCGQRSTITGNPPRTPAGGHPAPPASHAWRPLFAYRRPTSAAFAYRRPMITTGMRRMSSPPVSKADSRRGAVALARRSRWLERPVRLGRRTLAMIFTVRRNGETATRGLPPAGQGARLVASLTDRALGRAGGDRGGAVERVVRARGRGRGVRRGGLPLR